MPKGKKKKVGSIFLSHNHLDIDIVRKLYDGLKARGIRAWLDEAEIGPGESLISKIEAGIEDMDYLGVILSKSSVASEWVLREVNMALTEEIAGKRVKVIPLLKENCKIPGFLKDKRYIDFRGATERAFENGFDLLVKTIQGLDVAPSLSLRKVFIEKMSSVPEDARIFKGGLGVTKKDIISFSTAISDDMFDAVYDIWRMMLEWKRRADSWFEKRVLLKWIGGDEASSIYLLNQLISHGLIIQGPVPEKKQWVEPRFRYAPILCKMGNLMMELGIGTLRAEVFVEPGYWLKRPPPKED
jgi:hypothetical protein